MDAFVCERGVALDIGQFVEHFGNEALLKLKKALTIHTVDRMTKIPQRTPMFVVVKTNSSHLLELPRFCLDMLKQKRYVKGVSVELTAGERMRHEYIGQSNPNQQVVVKHIIDQFKKIETELFVGCTLKQNAGTGKSFTAMDLIAKVKRKTLIVVPNEYLLSQWVSLLTDYFPTARIGKLYGKHKSDGDIIVSIINSAADLESFTVNTKLPWPNIGKALKYMKQSTTINVDDLYAQIGLTIFDESQMYVSKEFRKVFKRVRSRFTLGLSATPDIREDKLDRIHQSWLGPILVANGLEGYSAEDDAFMSTATVIKYHAQDEHCEFKVRDDGMMDYQSIIESLVTDPNRNRLLVDRILQLASVGHHVFVFSDRRSHLEHLHELLSSSSTVPLDMEFEDEQKVILYGGSTEQTIQKANDTSKIIFTTYQYSSTGVSIKKMDALVLTTPRRTNMTQIINRVFRLGSDQTIRRQIVDVVDAKMPIKRQHLERLKAYQERGSEIVYDLVKIE